MTDETKPSDAPVTEVAPAASVAAPEPAAPPAEAPANVPAAAPEPTHAERAVALIAEVEHAHATNSPLTAAMVAELKALLG